MDKKPGNSAHGEAGDEELDRLFGAANPNPGRIGCPSPEVLRALAGKQRPIGDPAYEHLANCSPCYREFRQLQARLNRPLAAKAYFALGVSALILLVAVGGYLIRDRDLHRKPPELTASKPAIPKMRQLTADLRNASPARGPGPLRGAPVKLSRDLIQLTVILPIGSDPGRYNLRLVRESNVVAAASTDAAKRNFTVSLIAILDLRLIEPANYSLEISRAGEHAESYPVLVQ